MCYSQSVQRHKNMLEKREQGWGAVRSCCALSPLLGGHQGSPSACVPGTTTAHPTQSCLLLSSGDRNEHVTEWSSERLKVWKLRGSYSNCLFPEFLFYTGTTLRIINVVHANDVHQNFGFVSPRSCKFLEKQSSSEHCPSWWQDSVLTCIFKLNPPDIKKLIVVTIWTPLIKTRE